MSVFVPIDKNARIGFFLLAIGLIESAIADGIDNENSRIARMIGLSLLAEAQMLPDDEGAVNGT